MGWWWWGFQLLSEVVGDSEDDFWDLFGAELLIVRLSSHFYKFRDFWRGGNCVKTLVFPCYITLPTAFESLFAVVLPLHNQGVLHTVDKNKLKLIGTVSSCNLTTAG